VPTSRSQIALARGALRWAFEDGIPAAAQTPSKAAVNLLSRSRIRNASDSSFCARAD